MCGSAGGCVSAPTRSGSWRRHMGDVATEPVSAGDGADVRRPRATRQAAAYLEDPERLAAVRARSVARTLELLDRVRELAGSTPRRQGLWTRRASSGPSGTSRPIAGTSGWVDRGRQCRRPLVPAGRGRRPIRRVRCCAGRCWLSRPANVVPTTCWVEVGHALVASRPPRPPAGRGDRDRQTIACRASWRSSRAATSTPWHPLRVALDLGLGVYDSAYLVLSRVTGQSLVTADRRQYEVGIAAGYDVVWLGDLTVDLTGRCVSRPRRGRCTRTGSPDSAAWSMSSVR